MTAVLPDLYMYTHSGEGLPHPFRYLQPDRGGGPVCTYMHVAPHGELRVSIVDHIYRSTRPSRFKIQLVIG